MEGARPFAVAVGVLGVALCVSACDGALGNAARGDGGGDAAHAGDGAAEDGNRALDGSVADGPGGGGGPTVDRTDPQLHDFEVDPADVDDAIADSTGIQFAALDTRVAPVGQLVVFLPGANNLAIWWADHARELASYGFHVVVPHYNNRWSTEGACDGMGGSCSLSTRWEALVGEDVSAAVSIARRDSAEGRVVAMLEHLDTLHPGGDWAYFLTAEGGLRYGEVIIAGISHGAASAGLFAERRPFARLVMHASGPAGERVANPETPKDAWYGFVHTGDGAYDAIVSSWSSYDLLGALTSVDGAAAPYGGAHQLISSATVPGDPHIAVCVSSASPMAAGDYVYAPAWRALYGVAP